MATSPTAHAARRRAEHPDSWVWFEDGFARYHDVNLGLMTHALHYGTGCFEGIRAYWNAERAALFLLQPHAHYERLHQSARILGLRLDRPVDELVAITAELMVRNGYREDAYIRPLLFKSSETFGVPFDRLAESLAVYCRPFGMYHGTHGAIRCKVSSWQRVSDGAIPARAKVTGAYINSVLAKSEAQALGFDEAIVLNAAGHVAEGSTENLFLLRDGRWVTPPVTEDILEGITRRLLMELVREELGMEVVERPVDRTELYACSELLLCGTGSEVSPVGEVDGRRVGDGGVGPLTRRLQELYFRAARGDDPGRVDWVVRVEPAPGAPAG